MFSIKGLHKWLFGLTLILSLSTAVNATTYECSSSNDIELVVESNVDDILHFHYTTIAPSLEIAFVIFNTQLVVGHTNTVYQQIRTQNNELLNEITNYQLSFLQLLTKTNVLTALG